MGTPLSHYRHVRRPAFRADIQGLRAVAILAVVAYHAHVSQVGGGFVGVDIFFVISGFLITSLLWREIRERGTVALGRFYGRRARRLLPSAAIVIVATVAGAAVWLPPLEARAVVTDGVTAAFYVANYRFAAAQTNYLQATTASPLQHFWSLGVEEQFYVLWPALLIGVAIASRRARSSRPAALAVVAVLAVTSFAFSDWLTGANQPWAFFSLPSRAWEFAAGGFVALAIPQLRRLPARLAVIGGWVGLGMVVWSVFGLSSTTPFPGVAALAPVVGTAVVIAAGCAETVGGPRVLLGTRPMQQLGRVSYTWYLWHWPLLILWPAATGHALTEAQGLGLAVASLVLAAGTTRLVEEPVRSWSWLAVRRRSLALGAGLSLAAVAGSLLVDTSLPSLAGHGVAPVANFAPPPPPSTGHAGAGGRGRPSALLVAARTETRLVNDAVTRSVGVQDVPTNLEPPLASAHVDEAPPFFDGCFDTFTDATVHPCVYGDTSVTSSRHTVVLFGDSHATMWFPAVDDLANAHHDRLISLGKAVCPPADLSIYSPVLGRPYTECDQWRAAAIARIQQLHPAVVIVSTAWNYGAMYRFQMYDPSYNAALTRTIGELRRSGARVVVIGPIPEPLGDNPDCLSAHLTSATSCNAPLDSPIVFDPKGMADERAVARKAGASYLSVPRWFCTRTTCPPMVDNMVVWRDTSHVTATYCHSLAPALGAALAELTRRRF